MARTNVTPDVTSSAGVTPTAVTGIADGHMFTNSGKTILRVTNGGESEADFTVQVATIADGDLEIPDRVIAVTNGESVYVGPFDPGLYNQKSGTDKGKIYIDYEASAEADFTVEFINHV